MEYRSFGSTNTRVSALGMGCSLLGAFWQGRDDRTSEAAIRVALEKGITFFDTSDSYGRGQSERILGRAVRSRRDKVTIATKCGLVKTATALSNALSAELSHRADTRQPDALRSVARVVRTRRTYSPGYVIRAAESSLRRLGTSFLDVFLLHSPPVEALNHPDLVDAMEDLKSRGRIRTWGVSVGDEAAGLRALALPGIGCLEVELNLCHADATSDLVPRAAEKGLAIIARQPFGSGKAFRAAGASARADGSRLGQRQIVEAALQFALQTPGVTTVIAGMSRPQHVERNVQAAGVQVPPTEIEWVRSRICGQGD
jgi:aryl-alcohol dehydrogenase-like predicted oxidoreductase